MPSAKLTAMKYASVAICLFFSMISQAAHTPRMKEEVAKIAVGPAPSREPAAASVSDDDVATDAVDQPLRKPKVISIDAPADAPVSPASAPSQSPAARDDGADAELTAAAAAGATESPATPKPAAPAHAKATTAQPAREEGTISLHGVDDEDEVEPPLATENATAKIDTSKPKSEVLKPTTVMTPPHFQKPGKVAPTIEALAKEPKPVEGVSPEQALKWLENGNVRYVTKKFRADGRGEKERANKSLKPHAIILSCSDSRIPPELIFDQGLGEIATIRTAGEVLDLSVIASIEQAILHDHPHLLVVLGHSQCTSIEQALSWKDAASLGSDALDRMVSEIKPHLKSAGATKSPGLQIEAALQADGVARELPEHSTIIKKAVESGDLKIKTGLYWIETGKVKFY